MVRTLVPVIGLALLAAACSQPASTPSSSAPEASAASAQAPASTPETAQNAALLASLPAPYNTGDVDNGQTKFALCQACHSIQPGAPNMTGPNLHGIFGRKAGTLAGFAYSDPMKAAGWTWDAARLDTWLAGPAKVLPGTKMTFIGLPNPRDRIDLIAYLKVASSAAP